MNLFFAVLEIVIESKMCYFWRVLLRQNICYIIHHLWSTRMIK